jgi:hypothetical protein
VALRALIQPSMAPARCVATVAAAMCPWLRLSSETGTPSLPTRVASCLAGASSEWQTFALTPLCLEPFKACPQNYSHVLFMDNAYMHCKVHPHTLFLAQAHSSTYDTTCLRTPGDIFARQIQRSLCDPQHSRHQQTLSSCMPLCTEGNASRFLAEGVFGIDTTHFSPLSNAFRTCIYSCRLVCLAERLRSSLRVMWGTFSPSLSPS